MIKRVILIVMDSVGVGQLPDADRFGDTGAHTLLHVLNHRGGLDLPNLCDLGLGKIVPPVCGAHDPSGCFGKMAETSPGKDTITGHWELAGLVIHKPFLTHPKGFPRHIIDDFEQRIGRKTLGNVPRSGTVILDELGEAHLLTGRPIVYTSADSVFQIATHEDLVPLDTLYEYCRIARNLLTGDNLVARVIARPFGGSPGKFVRNNGARKDFTIEPTGQTLLSLLKNEGLFTLGIGKIGDIFAHRGLTGEVRTNGNDDGIDKTLEAIGQYCHQRGLIFVNLVDFDMVYGHRRNPAGYGDALEAFDRRIPELVAALGQDDVLMITADHGCDPTYGKHTDHTREYVPILVYGPTLRKGVDLGIRASFADCGQTVADLLGAGQLLNGVSLKKDICHG